MKYYGHKFLDKFLCEKYSLLHKKGLAIEAGALDGVYLSSCKVLEDNGWKCINIEPNPIEFAKLIINRPLATNINIGLSEKQGLSVFEVGKRAKNGHLIGLDGIAPHFQIANPKGEGRRGGTIKYEVKITTYKDLIEDLKINRVDLFVLDVEGWEVQVIKGMKGCNVLPEILCVEACPSNLKIVSYEKIINDTFNGLYKKDSSSWLNDIYIRS